MTKRINVVLPVETIEVLDRLAPKGNLARRLKEGALANAQRDLEIAQEWFPLDEEAWQRASRGKRAAKLTIPAGATSTWST